MSAQGHVKDAKLAEQGVNRIEWAEREMPVLRQIKARFEREKPLKGKRIAACLHVTTETANLMLTLKAGGGEVALCASNPLSTQDDVASALVHRHGIATFAIKGEDSDTYYNHINAAIDLKPEFTMDDGADFVTVLHTKRGDAISAVIAGTEETTTGGIRRRSMAREGPRDEQAARRLHVRGAGIRLVWARRGLPGARPGRPRDRDRGGSAPRAGSGDGRVPGPAVARGGPSWRRVRPRHRQHPRPGARPLPGHEGRRDRVELGALQRGAGPGRPPQGVQGGAHRARLRRGVHAPAREAHLRAGRGAAHQPRGRGGTPGVGDGHELRQPGAGDRISPRARARAQAERLSDPEGPRRGDRAPQAGGARGQDRHVDAGTGRLPRLLAAGDLSRAMWPLGRLSVRRKFQILGLCLLCIGAFLTLALVTRDGRDQAVELLGNAPVRNQGGVLGAVLSGSLVSTLGMVGAWALPLAMLLWGWNRLRLKPALETGIRTALGAIGLFILLGFLHLITSGNRALSGGAGEIVAMTAARLLGKIGGELVLGTALVVVGVIAFEIGSSQRARQAIQAVLAFFALPFRKQKPAAGPGERLDRETAGPPAAAPGTRGRKTPAIEEAEIASAWEPGSERPRPPSRPRIVSRRDEARD